MKYLLVFACISIVACSNDIPNNEVDKLVNNQVNNNRVEIERVKRELKAFKIEKLSKNIVLIKKLESVHMDALNLNDSIEVWEQDIALVKGQHFINRIYKELDSFQEIPFELSYEHPLH